MNVISRIKEHISAFAHDSFPQLLTRNDDETANAEGLREAMLALLEHAETESAAMLRLRMRCATSLRSLWFMRGDVMAVLGPMHGESEALRRVELACAEFRDALPAALRSRPSPLNRSASSYVSLPSQRR